VAINSSAGCICAKTKSAASTMPISMQMQLGLRIALEGIVHLISHVATKAVRDI
jgi:hypothetical protein